jgi:hypothetical protein
MWRNGHITKVERSLRVKHGRIIWKIKLGWWLKELAKSKKIVVGKWGKCQGGMVIDIGRERLARAERLGKG